MKRSEKCSKRFVNIVVFLTAWHTRNAVVGYSQDNLFAGPIIQRSGHVSPHGRLYKVIYLCRYDIYIHAWIHLFSVYRSWILLQQFGGWWNEQFDQVFIVSHLITNHNPNVLISSHSKCGTQCKFPNIPFQCFCPEKEADWTQIKWGPLLLLQVFTSGLVDSCPTEALEFDRHMGRCWDLLSILSILQFLHFWCDQLWCRMANKLYWAMTSLEWNLGTLVLPSVLPLQSKTHCWCFFERWATWNKATWFVWCAERGWILGRWTPIDAQGYVSPISTPVHEFGWLKYHGLRRWNFILCTFASGLWNEVLDASHETGWLGAFVYVFDVQLGGFYCFYKRLISISVVTYW